VHRNPSLRPHRLRQLPPLPPVVRLRGTQLASGGAVAERELLDSRRTEAIPPFSPKTKSTSSGRPIRPGQTRTPQQNSSAILILPPPHQIGAALAAGAESRRQTREIGKTRFCGRERVT